MKRSTKIYFILCILMLVISIPLFIYGFSKCNGISIISGIMYLIAGLITLKETYQYILVDFRKTNLRYNQLTDEELEIIEDTKELINIVDKNIIIADFNVYKINFFWHGWFNYDKDTKELSIFIPFKTFLRFSKDFCFMAVLHEVLHSQNLKNNIKIFDKKFLEGLNQFFTIWLIENYCEKYKIAKKLCIASFRYKNKVMKIMKPEYKVYDEEVKMVKEILENSGIDYKEIFLNYININPEFFRSFVPSKYFINSN